MSVTAIAFDYRAGGEVLCKNPRGLVFFLRAEPPAMRPAAPPPPTPTWQPVEATREVEVRRHTEPQPIAPRGAGTGPLPEVPAPGKQPEKGWFGKLFGK